MTRLIGGNLLATEPHAVDIPLADPHLTMGLRLLRSFAASGAHLGCTRTTT
jgi:hypothetical protein